MSGHSTSCRKIKMGRHGRAALLWGLGFMVVFQIAFFYPFSCWWPQLHDPQYGGKLARLRARLAEKPKDQPFILVLGSSHVGMGLRPSLLTHDSAGSRRQPFLFNFSMNDGCPVVSHLCLHRLLAEGIQPDCVLVETCPVQLWLDGLRAPLHLCLPLVLVQRRDLPLLSRYYTNPHQFRTDWRKIQLSPWYYHRDYLLSYLFPHWLSKSRLLNYLWNHTDEYGWQWVEDHTEDYKERHLDLEKTRIFWTDSYRKFHISDVDNKALREILEICQSKRIGVALLRMPEAKFFQSWYPLSMVKEADSFLARLSQEYKVPLIDARDWVPDSGFSDGHHLTPNGATIFTQRLDREVIQPGLGRSPHQLDINIAGRR